MEPLFDTMCDCPHCGAVVHDPSPTTVGWCPFCEEYIAVRRRRDSRGRFVRA